MCACVKDEHSIIGQGGGWVHVWTTLVGGWGVGTCMDHIGRGVGVGTCMDHIGRGWGWVHVWTTLVGGGGGYMYGPYW